MKLYAIKRTEDGKYYTCWGGYCGPTFSSEPTFWRTPDGVAVNLRKLCSEHYLGTAIFGTMKFKQTVNAWRNFDENKMKLYEVIVIEVDMVSMLAVPAVDFAQPEAVAAASIQHEEKLTGKEVPNPYKT